ncbi:MAG TPA: response regulator transcription factor [Candidatus Coproplasma excrementigallinarum]|uniref:Stage 0 sporulation protein A homolog n=1 Tax=Candidatus Coproplasma excrementigallinarum TaxID=2840747 RepID=A0A9D1MJ04_9FIRM|nr:response regulator transcription factor [Candidatus Coproplasma excrementigallinarum]
MNGTVFVLEDDASISGLIKVALEMNGISFEAYSNVKDFYAALERRQPDVALLDIMLPDGNGLDVLRMVKARYPQVCCIMLSALSKEEDKVNGLNLGADDYIAKPFSVLELTARVNAALRRKRKSDEITVGDLTLNYETMEVRLKGEKLELNKKEFELLKYFMQHAGKVLPRDVILLEVWGYEQGETRTLDNHISRLRKLGITNLETVFGIGYKLSTV